MKIKPVYGLWLILSAMLFMWLAALLNINTIISLILVGLFGLASIYVGFFTKNLTLEYKVLIGSGGIALVVLPLGLLLGEAIATLALIVLWLDTILLGFGVFRIPAYGFMVFLIACDALFVIPGGSVPMVLTILTMITGIAVGIDYFRNPKKLRSGIDKQSTAILENSATLQIFTNIWYLPGFQNWLGLLFAYRDIGRLFIREKSIDFIGETSIVTIPCFRIDTSGKEIMNIDKIFFGKQSGDFINNWIKFDFSSNQVAFFADGSWLGWGGILGGTSKILAYLGSWGKQPESTHK
jgi:hypothetical protein